MGTFDPGLFFGLLAIALGVFFGLRQLQKDVRGELTSIKERVIIIQERVSNVWDVVRRSPLFRSTGTVERHLRNLGKVKITAEPQAESTNYFIEVEQSIVLDAQRIIALSEPTGLNKKEREMFGETTTIENLLPHQIKLVVPSIDPKLCTDYIRYVLEWLDAEYDKSFPRIKDFEEPI